MSKSIFKALVVLALGSGPALAAGCGDDGDGGEADPCQEVTCKAHAHCLQGECVCDEEYRMEGDVCLPTDPCRFVICEENQHCDEGSCVCDEGYRDADGLCIPEDPCLDVDCASDEQCQQGICIPAVGECCDRGTLDQSGAEPECICDEGYNDEDGDLLCGPDDPEEWPPSLDDIYNGATLLGEAKCLLPECDTCGHAGDIDTSGLWTRRTKTVSSTCTNNLVQGYDSRAIEGNQIDEPDQKLPVFFGTCGWGVTVYPPREEATLIGNTAAACWINEHIMGVYSVEYAVVTYDPDADTLSGPGRAYVIAEEERPDLGIPCVLELEITYSRQ